MPILFPRGLISRSEIGIGNWTTKSERKITIAQRGNPQESSIANRRPAEGREAKKREREEEDGKNRNEKEQKKTIIIKKDSKAERPQLRALQPQEIEVQQNKTRSMNTRLEKIGQNGLEQPGSRRRDRGALDQRESCRV